MVLPTKHLLPNRSLIALGAEMLGLLDSPRTVSSLWDSLQARRTGASETDVTFDWYILALDFLFIVKAIELVQNRIVRRQA
jgi:hypothetical protein